MAYYSFFFFFFQGISIMMLAIRYKRPVVVSWFQLMRCRENIIKDQLIKSKP